jgi:hypothetical protein
MDSPIIVCSNQDDRRVDNAEDALSISEKLFVDAPGECRPSVVLVLLPGDGSSDGGR